MVLFNYSSKELTAKIVYYGPGLGGKTTCLEYIYKSLPSKVKGKMLSLSTQTDRTLFFDFLPMELGKIFGWRIRIQLYTVPGQVFYDATRKVVLKGADGVVFVVDSQKDLLNANIESWQNLQDNLKANNIDFDTIPLIIQYNKRDLKNISSVEELNAKINSRGVQYFETIATQGKGVMESLKVITKLVLQNLQKQYTKVFQKEEEEAKAEKEIPVKREESAADAVPKEKKEKVIDELSNVEEKMYDKRVLSKFEGVSDTKEEIAEPYEELANEDIAELPIKDEELALDDEDWQNIEIGKIENKIDEFAGKKIEPEPPVEELEDLTIIPEEEESIPSFEDTQKSKEKLSDTWKSSAGMAQAPKKKEIEVPPLIKQEKPIIESTKEISKEIEISPHNNIQQAILPVEVKLDTKQDLINVSIKIILSIKLKQD